MRTCPRSPADQMKLYTSIFNKKNGTALSPVKGEFCSLCHVRIRPQMLNEIRDRSQDLSSVRTAAGSSTGSTSRKTAVDAKPENAAE